MPEQCFRVKEIKQVLNYSNFFFFLMQLDDDDLVGSAMPQGQMKKEYLKVNQVDGEQET
jgi:hypothetical protein